MCGLIPAQGETQRPIGKQPQSTSFRLKKLEK